MIKHVVMWVMKDFAEGADGTENANKMKTQIEALNKLNEVISLEVGLNVSKSGKAFDIALYSVFESEEKLNKYRNHPEHKKVVEFINKVTKDVAVVDYEVN